MVHIIPRSCFAMFTTFTTRQFFCRKCFATDKRISEITKIKWKDPLDERADALKHLPQREYLDLTKGEEGKVDGYHEIIFKENGKINPNTHVAVKSEDAEEILRKKTTSSEEMVEVESFNKFCLRFSRCGFEKEKLKMAYEKYRNSCFSLHKKQKYGSNPSLMI